MLISPQALVAAVVSVPGEIQQLTDQITKQNKLLHSQHVQHQSGLPYVVSTVMELDTFSVIVPVHKDIDRMLDLAIIVADWDTS